MSARTRSRQDLRIHSEAVRIRSGGQLAPSNHCRVCGRLCTDSQSIERGVGPECWAKIARTLETVNDETNLR